MRRAFVSLPVVVSLGLVAVAVVVGSVSPDVGAASATAGSHGRAGHAVATAGAPIGPADGGGTNRGDLGRDGWYPDEPGLTPASVESADFGELFSTPVQGQVYAQPILDDGTVV